MSNYKHGKRNCKLYAVMNSMKSRCYNENNHAYKNYGKRGITICDAWLNDFDVFYNWAINNGYEEGLTIDRINVNGNYEPNNCRWVDYKTQNNNRRDNVILTYKGKTQSIGQWAIELNIPLYNLKNRYRRGWTTVEIFEGRDNKNIYLTYNNKTQTLKEWADELKVPRYLLYNRYHRGWSTKEILHGRIKKNVVRRL